MINTYFKIEGDYWTLYAEGVGMRSAGLVSYTKKSFENNFEEVLKDFIQIGIDLKTQKNNERFEEAQEHINKGLRLLKGLKK